MWIGWLEFDVLLGDVRSLKPHIRSSSCCPCAGACTALTTKWTGSQLCLPLPVASLALTT